MIQATFTISGSELTAELVEKIKSLYLNEKGDIEITISVKAKETPADAKLRIDRAIENIENRTNMVSFTPQEYDALTHSLSVNQ